MRILVVDDEPAVREAVERALRLEGHDVALAADAGQSLERARRLVPGCPRTDAWTSRPCDLGTTGIGGLPALNDWLETPEGVDFVGGRKLEVNGVSCHSHGFVQRV